jgi:hypothetical protein
MRSLVPKALKEKIIAEETPTVTLKGRNIRLEEFLK